MVAVTFTGSPFLVADLKRHCVMAARIEAPLDAHIVRPPVGMHFQIHHHRALGSGILGGLGVLRVHFRKNRGCDDAVFMHAMNRLVVLSAAAAGWDSSCDTAEPAARTSRPPS